LPEGDQGNDEANMEGNNLRDTIALAMWADYQQHVAWRCFVVEKLHSFYILLLLAQ
jgi:hypothetical protein